MLRQDGAVSVSASPAARALGTLHQLDLVFA